MRLAWGVLRYGISFVVAINMEIIIIFFAICLRFIDVRHMETQLFQKRRQGELQHEVKICYIIIIVAIASEWLLTFLVPLAYLLLMRWASVGLPGAALALWRFFFWLHEVWFEYPCLCSIETLAGHGSINLFPPNHFSLPQKARALLT